MRAKRVWASVVAAVVISGFGIAGAAPASANQSVNIDCDTSNGVGLVFVAGETVTVDLTNCYSVNRDASVAGNPSLISFECIAGIPNTLPPNSEGGTCFITTGPGITRVTFTVPDPVVTGTGLTLGNVSGRTVLLRSVDGSAPAEASQAPAPIPDWVQAHGRVSKDATCEDGWGQSWQEWAVSVTGGWVCTRSIPSLG